MSQAARQHKSRESQRLGLWVGLSIGAHGMALLFVGVVSRTCGTAASPGRTASKGVVTLEVSPQPDGPVGKTTRPTRDVRTEPGPVVDRGAKHASKNAKKQPTKRASKRRKRPQKVAVKPAPRKKDTPSTAKPPAPKTDNSLLDMRSTQALRTPTDREKEWKQWKDIDPQLAAQLRYGALPRLSGLLPTTRALVAAFPPDKPVERHIVTKQLAMTTYRDGGRLVKNRTGRNVELPPRLGRQPGTPGHVVALRSGILLPHGVPKTLAGIANLRIRGKGAGRVVCDLFRWDPSPDAQREVVLFMDTSGSMADKINQAQICAAGVARSALKRGYRVAVFNFSDFAYFQQATRDPKKLHRIIAVNIGGFTALPRITAKHLTTTKTPRDFVVVSDGLFNKHVKGSVASHRKAFGANKANRAFFYLFGSPLRKHFRHPQSVFARLQHVGYRTRSMNQIRRSKAVANKSKTTPPLTQTKALR